MHIKSRTKIREKGTTRMKADIARCHDDGCSEREQCLRWLDRNNPHPRTVHMASLFPYDIPLDSPCPCRIPPKEESDNA